MASPAFPEPPPAIPPTSLEECDRLVDKLALKKDEWTKTSIARRLELLCDCLTATQANADAWVKDGCKRKGIPEGDVLAGEEYLAGPMTTIRNVRLLMQALEQGGQPKVPEMYTRGDGQVVARVFPTNLQDKLMFSGVTGEVWIEKGKEPTQGAIYRDPGKKPGAVSLVLGAGNVSSIPPMDVLYKLFVEDEVVILKMNPVNADAGPHIAKSFQSLIDAGLLAVVYGGAEVGAHLANHPKVDTLHVTGSDRTYDAIVWGTDPEEQKRRKKDNDPINKRPFTAELGCVTPVFVIPGPWSDADIEYQARHVAGMVAQNASFNCNAAKVLVTAKGWDKREVFLRKVDEALAAAPPRKAYYPGAQQRYEAFLEHYPKAHVVGQKRDGVVPWTILPNVSASPDEYALKNEAFCGVLAEVALEATTAKEFVEKALPFANDVCWGTLSTCMLVHPSTEKELGASLDSFIAGLRYGGIGVNVWPGLIYGLVVTTWGAFPGHPPTDIQSGAGVVHNTFLFDHPERSVLRAPFIMKPTPVYFADHKNLMQLGKKQVGRECDPGWGKLVGVALAALKG